MTDIKKLLPCVCLSFIFCTFAFGQHKLSPLKIGDKLPDVVLDNVLEREGKKALLRDHYKNGLLIIDFWATYCIPCIKEMVFLDSLKSKHEEKFNVVMVTSEDESMVNKFLMKPKNRALSKNLVIATGDTSLKALFPHKKLPHNVWIDSTGTIKAITAHSEITEKNIFDFLANKDIILKTKNDLIQFDPSKEFHAGDTNFVYRSIITRFTDGIGGGVYGGTSNGIAYNRFLHYNGSIADLYWDAYSMYGNSAGAFRWNMVEIHTRDSLKLLYPTGRMKHLLSGSKYRDFNEWEKDNCFSYALTLPQRVKDTIFRQYMFSDLERQFNIRASIEARVIACTIVTRDNARHVKNNLTETKGTPEIRFLNGYRLTIKNATINEVLTWWFQTNQPNKLPNPYLVEIPDRANEVLNLILDFSGDIGKDNHGISTAMFHRQLMKVGFKFKQDNRPYPILILRDIN